MIQNHLILYTAKDDSLGTFSVSERGLNLTPQTDHSDITSFSVDVDNNYIILSDRLDMQTGKSITVTSSQELPTPLLENTEYFVSVLEIRSIVEGNVGPADTVMTVEDGSMFPLSGTIYVNGEQIQYSNRVGNLLPNLQRGVNQTIARSHLDEDKVYVWDRILRISETCDDALDRVYIPITDSGQGTHTINGSGQEVTLFTGFKISRPQALIVRELNAYTSYGDIERDIFAERVINVNFSENTTVSLPSNQFSVSGGHPFSEGELVRFDSPFTGLTAELDSTSTTIPVSDTSMFDSSGVIRIENEWISYTGSTANSFTGATRGHLGSNAAIHAINSGITGRGYETTGNVELDGTYRVRRISATDFVLIDDSDVVIDIITDANGTYNVTLHDFNGAERWSEGNTVTQPLTSSSGTISWLNDGSPKGRILYIDSIANNWSNSDPVTVQGSSNTVTVSDIEVINSLGDYTLTECDFNGFTFDQIESGGNAYAQGFKSLFSMIREEVAIDITRRYYIPNLTFNVQTDDPNWVSTTDTFANFDALERGHISLANSTFQGLLRGFVAPNRPVVEVDPTTNLNTVRETLGRVTVTIGSQTVNGDFSSPPTAINSDMTIEIADNYYQVVSSTSTTITVLPSISVTGLSANDVYIGEAFISNAIWSGNGSGGTSTRRHWQNENAGYGLGLGNTKKYIRIALSDQIANSDNWRVSSETSFDVNEKGHISQLITNATGIIRVKNTAETTLNGAISDIDTTITVVDATQFPSSGRVLIEDELLTYTSRNNTQLLGVVRGTHNTSAILHLDGASVTTANISDPEPNTVIVEVISGTFDIQATNTVSVGNGSASGNDIRIINSIEDRTKGLPTVNQLMYNDPVDANDPNGIQTWQIEEVYQTNNETVVVLDQPYTEPIDPGNGNGTANLLNTIKEYD